MNGQAAAVRVPARTEAYLPWLVGVVGLAVMYAPVYWRAAHGPWQTDEDAHGPLVAAVVLWLFSQVRHRVAAGAGQASKAGYPVFALGLACYLLGRAADITSLEFISQIFVVAGGLLLVGGTGALRAAWFPVFYLIFLVPLPGSFVDAVTGSLKQWISVVVQNLLFAAGYPIANTGVILSIGQYQLMVADACSGLNSMFSLSALGTLFMYLMQRKSIAHNAIMLASILPIAFVANIARVIILVLLTYHFGDEAGQGFLHGAAGIALMTVALCIFAGLDYTLASLFFKPASTSLDTQSAR